MPGCPWLLVLAVVAGCGRVGFDAQLGDAGAGDDDAGDAGIAPPGVRVDAYEISIDVTPKVQPIAAVDPSRTMVICDLRTGSSDHDRLPTCELTSPTTLTVTTGVADASVVVRAQVVQLAEGTVVQRGTSPLTSGSLAVPVPIQPVDLTRAFILATRRGTLLSSSADESYSIVTSFFDATTIELRRMDPDNNIVIAWQVVELPGARVQRGQGSLPATITAVASTIEAVDLGRSFLVVSARVSTGTEADGLVRGSFANSSSVDLRRTGMATLSEVGFFAVETADAMVISGTTAMGANATVAVPIDPQIDPTRAAVFLSLEGGRAAQPQDFDNSMVTAALEPPFLRLERTTMLDVGGSVSWHIVQWP